MKFLMSLKNIVTFLRRVVISVSYWPENKDWWISKFKENGICEFKDHDYNTDDMIRGNGIGYFDWDPKDDYGFHIIGKLC